MKWTYRIPDWGRSSLIQTVIATYAGSVAVECFGIVGMAAVSVKGRSCQTASQR